MLRTSTRVRALLLAAALLVPIGAAVGAAVGAAAAAPEPTEGEAPEAPVIYKWVDTNGIAHYTSDYDRIPRGLRRGARQLPSAGATASAPPPPAAPPRATEKGRAGGKTEAERWARTDRPRTYEEGWEGSEAFDEGSAGGEEAETAEAEPSYADVQARLHELDQQIAALEADIAADEEVLKRYVAAPPPQSPAEIAYDVPFREVAERLPRMLAELRTLQDERAGLQTP